MTASPAPELSSIFAVSPDFHAWLHAAGDAARAEVEPALLGQAERVIRATLCGERPETGGDPAMTAFAAQFVTYVAGVDESHLAPPRERVGDAGLKTLVEALYVLDATERLRLSHARLFPHGRPAPSAGAPQEPRSAPLATALPELHAAAMRLTSVDAETTELVRLQCAHHHDCGT